MTKQERWRKRNPWARYVEYARRRCKAPKGSKWWPYYGEKGILVTLTAKEARVLWKRDGAAKMFRPSLDRKDTRMGYALDNCRFREWILNVTAPHSDAAAAALEETVSFA